MVPMKDGKQHVFPASLIGQFSTDQGPRRKRRVYVARRGVPKVLHPRAQEAGLLSRHHRLYDEGDPHARGQPLDDVWQTAEGAIDRVETVMLGVERGWPVPAVEFVLALVPYVAHLLARPARIDLPTIAMSWPDTPPVIPDASDLTNLNSGINEHDRRRTFFAVLADAILFRSHWSIALAQEADPWMTNDLGMVWLPGESPGTFVIPMTPRHAVILGAGPPNYRFGARKVRIKAYEWSGQDVQLANELLALTASREVYALREKQAAGILDLWQDPTAATCHSSGATAQVLYPSVAAAGAWLLNEGRPLDSELSWARFMTAHHEFGCKCEQAFAEIRLFTIHGVGAWV